MSREITWQGEKNRQLMVTRPCECGCDNRSGVEKVGYLTGSDREGNGFTVFIQDEEVFQRVAAALVRTRSKT